MKKNDRVIFLEGNYKGTVTHYLEDVEFTVKFDDGRNLDYNWSYKSLFNVIENEIVINNVEKESEPKFQAVNDNTFPKEGMAFDISHNKGVKKS